MLATNAFIFHVTSHSDLTSITTDNSCLTNQCTWIQIKHVKQREKSKQKENKLLYFLSNLHQNPGDTKASSNSILSLTVGSNGEKWGKEISVGKKKQELGDLQNVFLVPELDGWKFLGTDVLGNKAHKIPPEEEEGT